MVSDWLISSNLVEEQNQYFFLLPVYILINDHEKYDVAPEEVMCCTMVEIKSWGTAYMGYCWKTLDRVEIISITTPKMNSLMCLIFIHRDVRQYGF